MTPFVFNTTRSIQFGAGALARVADIVRAGIGTRVMLVTDPGMMATGIVERAVAILRAADVSVALFADVVADPPEAVVLAAVDQARAAGVEGIVGLGGGSSLDVAKLVAVLALGQEDLKSIYGVGNVKGRRLPLILAPTTAGTGSEVTPWATVWDPDAAPPRKLSLHRQQTWPHTALVDPSLTRSLPRGATIAGALDALSHSLEAIWNRNANPVSDRLAVGAARKVIEFLPKVLASPADREGRSALSLAATMAGLAFSNTKTALAHEISYALTLQRGITHGIACSAPLPLVWRLAQGKDSARDRVLAEVFDCPASDGAARLENFLHGVDVATDLRRYDFSLAEIDAILDKAQSGARGRNFIGAQAMRVA
jgi:phosphonate metabolism-associated iron-containing alcohol dehydrogenase